MVGRNNPNGCGPWWLPDNYKDGYFVNECNIHDEDYSRGENRLYSDRKFYEGMKERIRKDDSLNWIQKKSRFAQAWAFYHLVRRFGWSSHKGGLG